MIKILFALLMISLYICPVSAQVAVIANKSVPVDDIDQSTLLDYYSGDARMWPNGKPVTVFDLKPKSSVKKAFYKFLGKSTSRMKSIWMKRMLLGEGDPPESLETESAILKKVASTPEALGFVSLANVEKNVKVLIVIDIKQQEDQ